MFQGTLSRAFKQLLVLQTIVAIRPFEAALAVV